MHQKLEKIKKLLEFELKPDEFFIIDNDDFELIEVTRVVQFTVENEKLGITFYSDVHPCTVIFYIRMLQRHKVPNDYIIFETMYPKLNEKDEFIDMLFGDEADEEYYHSVFRQQYKKMYMAYNAATFGPKQ